MTSSFSAFAALFRHALIALGQQPAANKRETSNAWDNSLTPMQAGFSPSSIFAKGNARSGNRRRGNLERYFTFVEAVTNEFDRQLDSRK